MKELKKYYLMRICATAIFGVALGCLFLAFRRYAVDVFDVLLIAVGLLTAVMNLPRFLYSLFHVRYRGEWINLLLSLVSISFGVLLMLLRRDLLLLLLGIFSFVLPLVRIALVEHKREQFKKEFPIILFGLFMILVSLAEIEEVIFTVIGVGLLAVSAFYLLFNLLIMRWRFSAYAEEEDNQEK